MLIKQLKYDLKFGNKVLIIFYILAFFFAILTRIFLSIDNSFIMNIIGKVCGGVSISMIFNILINNVMRLWVRFKHNLYGDESYLTHTLPIKKETLYLSKILSSIITLFVSMIIIALTLFIAYYSKENLDFVKNMLLPLAQLYESSILMLLIEILFIFFLEIANILQAGYTGIILGHKMNNAKMGYSILYGFGVYMGTQIFAVLALFLVGLFNNEIMNTFITNTLISVDTIKLIVLIATITYTLSLIILYIVNIRLFKKGVNVD